MAILDKERADRYRDKDIYRSQERYSRVEGERAPTYRTESLHYRDDYGTSMDDVQYKGMEDQRRAFNKAVSKAEGGIATAQGQLDSAYGQIDNANATLSAGYNEAMGTIATAQGQVPTWEGWLANEAASVDVYSNSGYEGTYKLAPQSVLDLSVKFNQYNASDAGVNDINWQSTPQGISLNVGGYGAEWHNQLGAYQAQTKSYFDLEVAKAMAGLSGQSAQAQSMYNTSLTELEGYKGSLGVRREELKAANASLQFQKDERRAQLSDIRAKYQNRLSNMRETISGMEKTNG